ncbi:protein translocase subunit SecD [Shewanella sp. JM162201]|uniref:Protein translocase subunit SecD n=1 Tax=Shewanella jiangmenensis TaxID=2837387 RepID=A0ABS5UYU6_9GAMM|nr:protein translocase subunit SecD [Shewanella jiangmenensis]MBT1443319.1 protein translocase subunit SecD [Shewanella jiangmenensis]
MLTDQLLKSGGRTDAGRKPLNSNSPWQVLVLIVALLIFAMSALPSLYGEHASLTLAKATGLKETEVSQTLNRAGIEVLAITPQKDALLVTLKDASRQMQARQLLAGQSLKADAITLSMTSAAPAWLQSVGASPIKLGLDLRGGVQFLMQVDLKPVFDAQGDSLRSAIREQARQQAQAKDQGIRNLILTKEPGLAQTKPEATRLVGTDEALGRIKVWLYANYPDWQIERRDTDWLLTLTDAARAELTRRTVHENLTIMRGRIEELGITEAIVQRHGENRILIELPGVQDPVAAKRVLGATASLSFHSLSDSGIQEPFENTHVGISRQSVLGGEHIIDARAGSDEMGLPAVNIVLDAEGGKRMSDFSRDNIGKPMATRYSEYIASERGSEKVSKVISVATINSQLGSRFSITGLGSHQEAQELAMLLRAGSMTAPVTIQKERTIGPSLGAENIRNGFAALALGLGATLVFMALWYRRLGWVANVALLANLTMLLGLIALIPGAVLTLPGIAGLVLTVGMAVDTNVLIFERIRDKMKEGRSMALAIERGFDSAFGTILDANLTTMITALVLYAIGNGPLQGFALTLGLGLVTSMVTGILLSRIIINWVYGKEQRKAVRI